MGTGYFPRLAKDGIKKNGKLYIPYILTCIAMVMMFYIVSFLTTSEVVANVRGGVQLQSLLGFGCWVIAIFSFFFLFYSHSFLLRRRKKEFGLYYILGMNKKNIVHILFDETLMVAGISLVAGLFFGIFFSKLAELLLLNIARADIDFSLSISPKAILMTLAVFAVIYLIQFFSSTIQIAKMNAIGLLRSENVGEKKLKGNVVFAVAGLLILGGAYYIAVTIKNPVAAIGWFFVAVIMVIVATYLLFISSSVFLCIMLKKNKDYYYKPNHFVSISSMAYRMKRNGAGLASICILATMVLVMISSTTCLYFGTEDSINTRCPREANYCLTFKNEEGISDEQVRHYENLVKEVAQKNDISIENVIENRLYSAIGIIDGDTCHLQAEEFNNMSMNDIGDVANIYCMSIEDYNHFYNKNIKLGKNEILLGVKNGTYEKDHLKIFGEKNFKIKDTVENCEEMISGDISVVPSYVMVLESPNQVVADLLGKVDEEGKTYAFTEWNYSFDTGVELEKQRTMREELRDKFLSELNMDWGSVNSEYKEELAISFYSDFGGLLFLGIVLSITFILATVLIIYFKQISEGYEDQNRFEIMQNVGMTKKEIKKSINSQLLLVFFIPLIAAGTHLAFAFPMIRKLLLLFGLNNVALFVATSLISFSVFGVFYIIVYRMTANLYYEIVSGTKK